MHRNLQDHKHKSGFTHQYVHLNNISKTSYIRFYCLFPLLRLAGCMLHTIKHWLTHLYMTSTNKRNNRATMGVKQLYRL